MEKQKGNSMIIVLIIFLVLGAGVFLYISQGKPGGTMSSVTMEKDKVVEKDDQMTKGGFSGKVLAGKASPYFEFNKADYEKSLQSGRVVFLNFYANWCPTCRAETPDLYSGFDALSTDKVIGFRVNYNDTDTDKDEKNLAKEFGITYQHTKVILQDGKKVFGPETVSWDKETFLQEINNYL